MKSSRKKLWGMVILILFLITLGLAVQQVYRNVRQPALNRSLLTAVRRNDTASVIALLSAGADANSRTLPPDTRSLWLQLWDSLRGIRPQTGDAPTALLIALCCYDDRNACPPENVPLVKALLDAGAVVNVADEVGDTPLIRAAGSGKRETVRLLLDRGADIHARDLLVSGETALTMAAAGNDPSLVQLLLDRGAPVNETPSGLSTPLHGAAAGGNTTIMHLLLAKGASINVRDVYGRTPLWNATKCNNFACVKMLLANGAQVSIADNERDTPLYIAQTNQNVQIVKLLQKAGAKRGD